MALGKWLADSMNAAPRSRLAGRAASAGPQAGPQPPGLELMAADPSQVPAVAPALAYDELLLPPNVRVVRNDIVARAGRCELPSMLDRDILAKVSGRGLPGWRRLAPDGSELAYDLALTGFLDGNARRFLVRLQAPGRIKKQALDKIRKTLQREFGANLIAEVERIGEVEFLAGKRPAIGGAHVWGIAAAISISTGAPGRATVFLRLKGRGEQQAATHVLTAAHVLRDGEGRRCVIGERVYHPPTGSAAPTHAHGHVASVEQIVFQAVPARDAASGVAPMLKDAGLLALREIPTSPGDLPGGGYLKGVLEFVGEDPLPRNTEVAKVSAATPRSNGRVGGASSTVVFRTAAGVALAASGLIEIMGHERPFSADGDSGALVLRGGSKIAVGFVVAGTHQGELPGNHVGVSYALPLDSVLAEFGMEVAL